MPACAWSMTGPTPIRNLRFALPRELDKLAQFLRGDRVVHAELHHLLGHDHAVLELCRRLGVPYDAYIHDYAWFCPRISLLGPDRRYCGEPDVAHCEACVSDAGRNIEEDIPVAALRRRSAADLARARRVVAPSGDTAQRIARHFAGVDPEVAPWESTSRCRRAVHRRRGRSIASALSERSVRKRATMSCWPAPATPQRAT